MSSSSSAEAAEAAEAAEELSSQASVDFTYKYARATLAEPREIQVALESGDWTRFFSPDVELEPEAGDAAKFLHQMMDINATYREDGMFEDAFMQLFGESSLYRFDNISKSVVFVPVHVLANQNLYPFTEGEPPCFGGRTDWLHYAVALEDLVRAINAIPVRDINPVSYVFFLHGPKDNLSVATYPVSKGTGRSTRSLVFFGGRGDTQSPSKMNYTRPYGAQTGKPECLFVMEVEGLKLGWCADLMAMRSHCQASPHVCVQYAGTAMAHLIGLTDTEVQAAFSSTVALYNLVHRPIAIKFDDDLRQNVRCLRYLIRESPVSRRVLCKDNDQFTVGTIKSYNAREGILTVCRDNKKNNDKWQVHISDHQHLKLRNRSCWFMADAAEEAAVFQLMHDYALYHALGEIEGRHGETELTMEDTVAIIAHGNDNTLPYQTVVRYEGYPLQILSAGPPVTSEFRKLPIYVQNDRVPDGLVNRISLVADEATIAKIPAQTLAEKNCTFRCFLLLIGLHEPRDYHGTVEYFDAVARGHEAVQYFLYGTISHREYLEGPKESKKSPGCFSLETLRYFCNLLIRLRWTRHREDSTSTLEEENVAPKTKQATAHRYRTEKAAPQLMEHCVAIFFDLGFMVDPLKNICVQLAGMSRDFEQGRRLPGGTKSFMRLVAGKCGRFLVSGPVSYPYVNFIVACKHKAKLYKVDVNLDNGCVHNWCACSSCAPKFKGLRMYVGVRDIPLRMVRRPVGEETVKRKRKKRQPHQE